MRAYFFVNSALSGIQKGMQVAHCVAEMMPCLDDDCPTAYNLGRQEKAHDMAVRWGRGNREIIVLEGGNHRDLMALEMVLDEGPLWWSAHQDTSLGLTYTAVGAIVPERIYKMAEEYRKGPKHLRESEARFSGFTEWEIDFINFLNSCPLAR